MHDTGRETNPKSEARNPKQIQISNLKCAKLWHVILNEVKNLIFFVKVKIRSFVALRMTNSVSEQHPLATVQLTNDR
jgi:hypothetical protein